MVSEKLILNPSVTFYFSSSLEFGLCLQVLSLIGECLHRFDPLFRDFLFWHGRPCAFQYTISPTNKWSMQWNHSSACSLRFCVCPYSVVVPFHFKGSTIYVDNVPVWVCKKCGERYFDAPVFKKLENIARQRQRIQKMVSFPLANYASAPLWWWFLNFPPRIEEPHR